MVKVNRLREQFRRGLYHVDSSTVADRLLADHLLWSWALVDSDQPGRHPAGP